VSVAEAAREVLAREGDIAGTSAAWLDAASRLRREVRPSEPGADGILAALAAERDGRLERMLDREPRLDERPAA
jgi:hypothetical protein